MDKPDRSSDTESECSVTEVLSRDQIDEMDDGNLIRTNYNLEQRSIDQRFSEMNKQISDLTGLVLALTEKLSSNVGEGKNQSTASDKTCARSDKMATSEFNLHIYVFMWTNAALVFIIAIQMLIHIVSIQVGHLTVVS